MKNYISLICLIVCAFANNGYAQVSGTKTIGIDYATIQSFVLDINTNGIGAGGVKLLVPSGYAETAPAGGFAITATGTVSDSIIIQSVGTPLPVIMSSSVHTTGALTDAIFKLIGSDYVMIKGLSLQENPLNTATSIGSNKMTEWAIALLYATPTNGAQHNTLVGNTIQLNRLYANSFGIYANSNHTASVINVIASATSTTGGNSGLKIYSNTISNVNNGIVIIGPATPDNHDTGIDIGGTTAATGNTITNFGTSGVFSTYASVPITVNGIVLRHAKSFNISRNTITSSPGGTNNDSLTGIQIPRFSYIPTGIYANTIEHNTLSLESGYASGRIQGIFSDRTAGSPDCNVYIRNNNFTKLDHSISASGKVVGIELSTLGKSMEVTGNTFTSLSMRTTGTVSLIYSGTATPSGSSKSINYNEIVNGLTRTGTTAIAFYEGALTVTAQPNSSFNMIGNRIAGINSTAVVNGIVNYDGYSQNISNNQIENITAPGMALISVYDGGYVDIFNNTFTNCTTTGNMTGIYCQNNFMGVQVFGNLLSQISGTSGSVTGIRMQTNCQEFERIFNNTLSNLAFNGDGSNFLRGIHLTSTSNANPRIHHNTLFSFSGAGVPAASGLVEVSAIVSGVTDTSFVYNNKIYDMEVSAATGGSLTYSLAGIRIPTNGGKSLDMYNNIISDLRAPNVSGADVLRGISIEATNSNAHYGVYHNTIYLHATSSGTDFGTSGLYREHYGLDNTVIMDIFNNIIINESASNGTGITAAFRRSAGANTFSFTSRNNLYHAGTASASHLLFVQGTTGYSTLTAFQAAVGNSDAASSFTGETQFVYNIPGSFFESLTGSNAYFLKPADGIVSQIENGGIPINSILINTDYSGNMRAGSIGYPGGGTLPDVGAFEIEGIPLAPPVVTINSVTPPATTQCEATARTVNATVTSLNADIISVVLEYSFNGIPQTPVTMTSTGGNGWTGVIPAATPADAQVTWAVKATNEYQLARTTPGTAYHDAPLFSWTTSVAASANPVCTNDPVTLTLTVGGSTEPYTISWSAGAGSLGSTASIVVNPTTTTTYTAEIATTNCTLSTPPSITVGAHDVTAVITPIAVTCYNYADGSFALTSHSCGLAPFTYKVDGGAFGAIPTNLTAGSHTIVIKDANGLLSDVVTIAIDNQLPVSAPTATTSIEICQTETSAIVAATYATPNVSWWNAPTAGTQLGTNATLETIGTSVLPSSAVAGTYTFYAQGVSGTCFSGTRVPATVIVHPASNTQQTVAACDTYLFDGDELTTSGTYTATLATTIGCDSTITLHLTIGHPTQSSLTVSHCGTYMFHNTPLTASGTYRDTLVNSQGCDSVVTLFLTVTTSPSVVVTINPNGQLSVDPALSYEWLNCGTGLIIPGATEQFFTPTANGSYAVIVTNGPNCANISPCTTVNYVGLEENELSRLIQVFPNPASTVVHIETSGLSGTILVRNELGQLLQTVDLADKQQIQIDAYEPGVYLFEIRTAEATALKRIVKL